MSSRLTLIDSLDVDKSFSGLGNIVADAVGIKTSVKVITGTKEIGQVIYTETPPSIPSHAVMDHYEDSLNYELVHISEMV